MCRKYVETAIRREQKSESESSCGNGGAVSQLVSIYCGQRHMPNKACINSATTNPRSFASLVLNVELHLLRNTACRNSIEYIENMFRELRRKLTRGNWRNYALLSPTPRRYLIFVLLFSGIFSGECSTLILCFTRYYFLMSRGDLSLI